MVPFLQVEAVSVGAVARVQAQLPEKVLLVEDEHQATALVVELVLLCRVQRDATLDRNHKATHTQTHTHTHTHTHKS